MHIQFDVYINVCIIYRYFDHYKPLVAQSFRSRECRKSIEQSLLNIHLHIGQSGRMIKKRLSNTNLQQYSQILTNINSQSNQQTPFFFFSDKNGLQTHHRVHSGWSRRGDDQGTTVRCPNGMWVTWRCANRWCVEPLKR